MSFGRITPLMTTNQILGELNQSENALATTEEQLSTGKTINQPSDNPYGAALVVQLNGQLSQLGDYNNNIVDGQAWAQTGTTALGSIESDVQRAQELVTQAGNGTLSQSQQADIGAEIGQLISSIKASANTQYNGQYVFSGTAGSTPPYDPTTGAYAGGGAVTRQIGPASTATVSVDISQALGANVSTGTGLLPTLTNIYNQLTSGSGTAALNSSDLTDLRNGLDSLNTLQTRLGASTDQMTMASTTLSDMQTSLTSELGNTQDANMATTMTTYSNEQAAFTAALKAGASIVQTSLMSFLTG